MITIATHLSEGSAKSGSYRVRLLTELAIHNPEAHVIFILDSERHSLPVLPGNCTVNITGPRTRNRLLKKYYYAFKIPQVLQRYNAFVFIPEGNLTAGTRIKQVRIDDNRTQLKGVASKNLYGIITYDDKRKEILSGSFKKVISVLPGADSSLNPLSFEERIRLQDELTGGDEYFMACFSHSSIELFMPVMKAYSNFRKWQKSSMKLVLVAEPEVSNAITSKLANYKFRSDVVVRPSSELNNILPAAYVFIDTSGKDPFNPLNAFACDVPVISFRTVFAEAVLKAEPTEISISEKMMILYKEEITRLQHIAAGRQLLVQYNWKNNIERLMAWLEQ